MNLVTAAHPGCWPEDCLENLGCCPVCGSEERDLLFDGLIDRNQRCAPGRWRMYRCCLCGCGYLDPRPTRDSIILAYRCYLTHSVQHVGQGATSRIKRVKIALRNDYLNRKYGFRETPDNRLGWLLFHMLPPPLRQEWDHYARHLPKPRPGRNRLLDVGCGNGDILMLAQHAGWNVAGVDFDSAAVKVARCRGLEIHLGGLDDAPLAPGSFDVITAQQVTEHVHQPVQFLKNCWRLLTPSGTLWIGTPNLDMPARYQYGDAWQMLEVHRHLVVLTPQSLTVGFKHAGIERPTSRRRCWYIAWAMAESENIRRGERVHDQLRVAPA